MATTVQIVHNTKLFSYLNDEELEELIEESTVVNYKENELIITEGEIGHNLYIILSGAVRVFSYSKSRDELVLARLDEGDYFGEQALLVDTPKRRNASVKAIKDTTCLQISHDFLLQHLKKNKKLATLLKQLGQDQLITKLNTQLQEQVTEQDTLLSSLKHTEEYQSRQLFFRQGDTSKEVFYLLSGEVEIRIYNDKNELQLRTKIQPGQFFGERAIIEGLPRAASAVATKNSKVIVIEDYKFLEFYRSSIELKEKMKTLKEVYSIPTLGNVIQYEGVFRKQPAIHTSIKKKDGEVILASRVVTTDVFGLRYSSAKNTEKKIFKEREDKFREIELENNKLVGMVSVGKWEDLADCCYSVLKKMTLTKELLELFGQSGKLVPPKEDEVFRQGLCCKCMQVPYRVVQELIGTGIINFAEILKQTGAGTVCGACVPIIKNMLGENVWDHVVIEKIIKHNDKVRTYRLTPLKQPVEHYQAGQHVVVEGIIENQPIQRSYTLTSSSEKPTYYEITVKHEEKGLFSSWIFKEGKAGTPLRVSKPQGSFVFNKDETTPALCFMAGIGITPAIALMRNLIARKSAKDVYLDYSFRSLADCLFRDTLLKWMQANPHLKLKLRMTSDEGHISDHEIKKLLETFPSADIYICGPTSYEDNLTALLKKNGADKDRIHLEKFLHAGGPLGYENPALTH